MKDNEDFLNVIQENPEEDTSRLLYADWLEKRGDVRAEYLRLQLEPQKRYERLWELRNGIDLAWLSAVGRGRRFGDRSRFAVEVGELFEPSGRTRRVDMWAAGRWLTCADHNVHVGTFRDSVIRTIGLLGSARDLALPFPEFSPAENYRRLSGADDCSQEPYWMMLHNWGPTTDNVSALTFRSGEQILLAFRFCWDDGVNPEDRGVIFVVEISQSELLDVLQQMVDAL